MTWNRLVRETQLVWECLKRQPTQQRQKRWNVSGLMLVYTLILRQMFLWTKKKALLRFFDTLFTAIPKIKFKKSSGRTAVPSSLAGTKRSTEWHNVPSYFWNIIKTMKQQPGSTQTGTGDRCGRLIQTLEKQARRIMSPFVRKAEKLLVIGLRIDSNNLLRDGQDIFMSTTEKTNYFRTQQFRNFRSECKKCGKLPETGETSKKRPLPAARTRGERGMGGREGGERRGRGE